MSLAGGSREPALEPEPSSNLSFRDNSNRGHQTYTGEYPRGSAAAVHGCGYCLCRSAVCPDRCSALSRWSLQRNQRPQSHRFRAEAEAKKPSTIFYYPWFEVRKYPTRSSATLGPNDMPVLPRPWLVSDLRRESSSPIFSASE